MPNGTIPTLPKANIIEINKGFCDDFQFANEVRRGLIMIASAIAKRYGWKIPLLVLLGKKQDDGR